MTGSQAGAVGSPVVSFSGLDGCGKTSMAREVATALRDKGIPAEAASPRYRNLNAIRQECTRRWDSPYAYATRLPVDLHMAALVLDWLEWASTKYAAISPAVITCVDRYAPDVIAQSFRHGSNLQLALQVLPVLPRPALAVLLDVPVGVAAERLDRRERPPRNELESDEALERLAVGFDMCLAFCDVTRIDAARPLPEIVPQVVALVEDAIKKDRG